VAPAARVLAVDNDPVAVAIARDNVRLNRVSDRVRVLHAGGLNHPMLRHARPFDLVLANILPGLLIALAHRPELLVLSAGVRPRPEAADLAKKLKLPRTQEGFFLEAHPKLSPLDFSSAGFSVVWRIARACGKAWPRPGGAQRAAAICSRKKFMPAVSWPKSAELCIACLACVRSCPMRLSSTGRISVIVPGSGCGTVSRVPAKAIKHYTDDGSEQTESLQVQLNLAPSVGLPARVVSFMIANHRIRCFQIHNEPKGYFAGSGSTGIRHQRSNLEV
jgi:ferredoxin